LHNKPAGCGASKAYAKGPDGSKRTEQKPKVLRSEASSDHLSYETALQKSVRMYSMPAHLD